MSAAEHECCRHMARQCGGMQMPKTHSCCRTELPTAKAYVGASSPVLAASTVGHSTAMFAELHIGAVSVVLTPARIEHPPPEYVHTVILRI